MEFRLSVIVAIYYYGKYKSCSLLVATPVL